MYQTIVSIANMHSLYQTYPHTHHATDKQERKTYQEVHRSIWER